MRLYEYECVFLRVSASICECLYVSASLRAVSSGSECILTGSKYALHEKDAWEGLDTNLATLGESTKYRRQRKENTVVVR